MTRTAILLLPLLLILLPGPSRAQEEVTRGTYRYVDREVSTGYYERYEVLPGREQPFMQWNKVLRQDRPFPKNAFVPGKAVNRRFLADAHLGLEYYETQSCASCHVAEAKNNLHVVRLGMTCRQCHGGEPVAAVSHYYSQMNPIRRHAYVCAKCHRGASASFATYLVHEPNPADPGTRDTFPALFWVFWIMVAITAATFILFLPVTLLWFARELEGGRRDEGGDGSCE